MEDACRCYTGEQVHSREDTRDPPLLLPSVSHGAFAHLIQARLQAWVQQVGHAGGLRRCGPFGGLKEGRAQAQTRAMSVTRCAGRV